MIQFSRGLRQKQNQIFHLLKLTFINFFHQKHITERKEDMFVSYY